MKVRLSIDEVLRDSEAQGCFRQENGETQEILPIIFETLATTCEFLMQALALTLTLTHTHMCTTVSFPSPGPS